MGEDKRSPKPPDSEPEEDPDRAAILARRQRFIAIAISGLATGLGCDRDAKPTACLEVERVETQPQACLDVEAPRDKKGETGKDGGPKAMPTPCLEVAAPHEPRPEGKEDGKDGDGKKPDAKKPDAKDPDSKPRPCLRVRPKDPPKAQPCLNVLRDPKDPIGD